MQDFLALSPEYEKKRAEIRKKISISVSLCMVLGFALVIFGGFKLFSSFPMFVVLALVGTGIIVIGVTSESRYKKQLEKYGEELFREYMRNK